ncbi:MAG TPA: hypothetical protein VMZ52_02240, partial [Bryobacteraceae bacterium]|nr:hypothetical protein [Bryobacteraceae bacterium]
MPASLTHILRHPQTADPGPPPILMLLHGVGSNERDLMGLAPQLDGRFLVISVRAPHVLGPDSYGWYHVQFTPSGPVIEPEEAERSRLLILQFVEEAVIKYHADPRRVFLMGFSQGCIMSLSAALSQPAKFAGVVGMSGRLLPNIDSLIQDSEALHRLAVLVVHGAADTVLPIQDGRAIRDKLIALGVDVEYREYPMAHQVSAQSLSDIAGWLQHRLMT